MGLIWADGFDHYGNNSGLWMTEGPYARVGECTLTTAQVATGARSVYMNNYGGAADYGVRKVFPAGGLDRIGAAARFYVPALPNGSRTMVFYDFVRFDASGSHICMCLNSNGGLTFRRDYQFFFNGGSGTIIANTNPLISTSAWNHIEAQIKIHDTLGWIRIAVNGVHRYQATGLDTRNADSLSYSLRHGNAWHYPFDGGARDWYMDDLYIYDFTGDPAVDTDFCPATDGAGIATNYIGELQCMYLPPDGDTAEADWAKSTGIDGFPLIDDITPNDVDYILSATGGDLSEFALTNLPPEISYIRGLMLLARQSKTDAGMAMTKLGMKSVAAITDAAERPITVAPAYWWDFINKDPNSGARWTRSSLNAAWMRLIRSA